MSLSAVIERLEAHHRRSAHVEVRLAVEELREVLNDVQTELDEPEAHVCTCGDSVGCPGCAAGMSDRCRFELLLRRLAE